MMDSAPFPIGRHAFAAVPDTAPREHEGAPAEQLWREHGWSLGGGTVAALVGAVLVVSCVVQILG